MTYNVFSGTLNPTQSINHAGVVICLEQGANNLHMVQLMPLPPHHVPAYPACLGKQAIKRVSSQQH